MPFKVGALLENTALAGSWLERQDIRVQSRRTDWGFGYSFQESGSGKFPFAFSMY